MNRNNDYLTSIRSLSVENQILRERIHELEQMSERVERKNGLSWAPNSMWTALQENKRFFWKLWTEQIDRDWLDLIDKTDLAQLWELLFHLLVSLLEKVKNQSLETTELDNKLVQSVEFLYHLSRFVESEKHFPYGTQISLVLEGKWDQESWARRMCRNILDDPVTRAAINRELRKRIRNALGVSDSYFRDAWKNILQDLPEDLRNFHRDKTKIHRRQIQE